MFSIFARITLYFGFSQNPFSFVCRLNVGENGKKNQKTIYSH